MFPEMANEIQAVCWSKRTVPQHHELFRVRESRPLVVQLALTADNVIVYERVHDNYICMRPRCFLLCQQHVHDCRMGTHHKAHHTGRYCELIYCENLIVCILENHICNSFLSFFLVY